MTGSPPRVRSRCILSCGPSSSRWLDRGSCPGRLAIPGTWSPISRVVSWRDCGGIASLWFIVSGSMSFDLLAPHYRWMELVMAGDKLQRCRTAFLPDTSDADSVLILGEGNGRFLFECRKVLSSARITCVDSSSRMLQLARSRLERRGLSAEGIQFIHADALSWKPPERSFDLIATHFFLDCFRAEQLGPLVTKLTRACRPRSRWLLADFQIPAGGINRWRARLIHWIMYCFFRLATRLPAKHLTVPDPILASNGFILRRRRVTEWELLRSDLWERP